MQLFILFNNSHYSKSSRYLKYKKNYVVKKCYKITIAMSSSPKLHALLYSVLNTFINKWAHMLKHVFINES